MDTGSVRQQKLVSTALSSSSGVNRPVWPWAPDSTAGFPAAMASSAARITCSRLVPLVIPRMAPLAYMSQWGAPRPVKAGTT